MEIYDVKVLNAQGEEVLLRQFSVKALLIVNTASKCGFTPQYEGLQALQERYAERGFSVLGFPCNQFGKQEPGSDEEIQGFCSGVYHVTFPVFSKINVNGPEAHPLYQHLTKVAPGMLGSRRIKWNFTKFLVDPTGNVVKRYAPQVAPASIAGDIEKVLPREAGAT